MEPWRKRGFVPDSDDEDEFQSSEAKDESPQNAQNGIEESDIDLEYITIPTEPTDTAKDHGIDKEKTVAPSDVEGMKPGFIEPVLGPSAEIEPKRNSPNIVNQRSLASEDRAPKPRRRITYGNRLASTKATSPQEIVLSKVSPNEDDTMWDIPSSPGITTGFARKSRRLNPTPNTSTSPKSTQSPIPIRRKLSKSGFTARSRSSSPDELNVVMVSQPESTTTINHAQVNNTPQPVPHGLSDDSPLSSPPSSLKSPPLELLEPLDNMLETTITAAQQEIPDEAMSEVEITQELLQQSTQMRRNFRERNAIQLHPYALEMANYQKQMRERGVKPIRMAIETRKDQAPGTTEESQRQDNFNPDALNSSPPPEEYFRDRPQDGDVLRQIRHNGQQSPAIHRSQSSKRQKKSYAGAWKTAGAGPQIVTANQTPPNGRTHLSILDIPSSSPHSGSLSPKIHTPHISEGFRFPLGFTPPPTTTTTTIVSGSKSVTPKISETNVEVVQISDAGSDIEANSDSSEASFVSPKETAQERQVRLMQRRTRGVLPASWVRLNAQQKIDEQRASQHTRNATSNRTDGKGVARKVARKAGNSGSTSIQRSVFIDLGDSEDSDEDDLASKITNTEPGPETEPLDEAFTRIVGFPDPFDQDGDIMEDNRIDYMIPTVSRKSASNGKLRSLKRGKPRESTLFKERQSKRPRIQRQTRLTDSSYGGRRTKPSTKRQPPRLGVLDVPDVASRPRKEQPQFLRIAARKARSRRDSGRQSPTRKFVQLGSKLDTLDANKSLRDWRHGAIPQSKAARPKLQSQKHKPLANTLSGRHRAAPSARSAQIPVQFASAETPDIFELGGQHVQHDSAVDAVVRAASVAPSVSPSTNPIANQSARLEKRGNQWVVQRNVVISSLHRNTPRPAATSLAGPARNDSKPQAKFGKSLILLNRDYQHQQQQTSLSFKPSLTLDRFISNTARLSPSIDTASEQYAAAPIIGNKSTSVKKQKSRRRLKKHAPKRINVNSDEFIQDHVSDLALTISDLSMDPEMTDVPPTHPSSLIVGGLFNWETSYPIDFGMAPLRNGTYFHESTFIGSGESSRSLHVLKRDLDRDAGLAPVTVKDQTLYWGAWNEKVSSEMGSAFDAMIEEVEKSVIPPKTVSSVSSLISASERYRAIINYGTEKLSFTDPVDRTSFITRTMALVFRIRDPVAAFVTGTDYNKDGLVKIACYNLVFSNQIYQIASHALVNPTLANDALDLVRISAKDVFAVILSETGIAELQHLFEEIKRSELREAGLRDGFSTAEAYVIVKQLLHTSETLSGLLRDLYIDVCIKGSIRGQRNVRILENAWRGLFTLLPLNEIDHRGIAIRNSRFKHKDDNWTLVKELLSPALDHYDTNSANHSVPYNAYCRALFLRCHRLINAWGWRDCKHVLDTLYDFFAQKTLYNLKHEESHGSPSFLDELDKNPSLEARAGEPCFHTLLKIIASGLRFLSQQYDKKKVRNFAWRLLPNHGRVYPKDQALRHEDLDALRNHHDLLCTLYWAVPDGCRPRLAAIRNLVDPSSSHRETCNINLRSWTRLVRFQLSTDEAVSELEPFADWHSYFLTQLRQQHLQARQEIEAQSKSDKWASKELIESTISQNQRQIESLLNMALAGMQSAVDLAPSIDHAYRLISKTPFEPILGLFNPKTARVNSVVSEAIRVILAYTRKDSPAPPPVSAPVVSAPADEDSQEFEGLDNWADIDEVWTQKAPVSEAVEYVEKVLRPAVYHLVSNCFGADYCPEDAILVTIVDCWTSIAQLMVRHGFYSWDRFLSSFGDESWAMLRATMQTRKFAAQFLAMCINKDAKILIDSRILVMNIWMSSLTERSSTLKFQHQLTEAILNGSLQDPLLQNLPFSRDLKDDRYSISLHELSQRRVALLASLLSNMREHVLQLEASGSREVSVTRQEYSGLLQQLMTSMKENYRELSNGAAGGSIQGAYVDFVHNIVRFLQELTSDIRPVEPFFTDPAFFPLPTADPRYVVAKLKRYEPKLSSSKEVQTLTIFIQSINERATVEGQQMHLVDQLYTAMKDTYEAGRLDKPTLRAVLLQCIFPVYLELTFSTPAAWLLSQPIIKSVSLVFKDLLFNLDTTDPACVSSLLKIFDIVFQSLYHALRPLCHNQSRFKHTTVLAQIAAFIEIISSSLVVIDYIDRTTDAAEGLISYIQWFKDFVVTVSSYLATSDTAQEFQNIATKQPPDSTSSTLPQHIITARRLAFEDHQSYLKNWSVHGSKYYYSRPGHESKEILLEPAIATLVENAASAFADSSAEFLRKLDQLEFLSE
ncbi:hypothetical protein N7495_004076 [Penicillium taxi]|uniref:uncharacterized protein n=1 Tax=Penicillium taxi TaxID=168475 RepID=UPI0025456A04|nr:uncharacterized protein N7495_004076 [Penicillium taxi]KAJ5899332.1 hypothetical protein N7495_004076 [Penicillium taxi]